MAKQGIYNTRWCDIERPFAFTVGVFAIGKWVGVGNWNLETFVCGNFEALEMVALRLGNRYLVHRDIDFE